MSDETDVFHDVAAQAMQQLVTQLESILEPNFVNLPKMAWANWGTVGDQSDYINTIQYEIEQFVPTLREMLPPVYFSSFCDKWAASCLPRYLQAILKCKRINEMGTQQLLLDTYGLKTIALKFPTVGAEGDGAVVPPRYTKLVSTELGRTEAALKLVGTPTDRLVQSFKMMWPDGTPTEFQRIMAVKGLKKSEQQSLLEMLGVQKSSSKKSLFGFN